MSAIKIKDLTYYYPGARKAALEKINLEIPEGQFVLVVGGSGSGKSTLLRAISGLIPNFYGGSYRGQVWLDNQEISGLDRYNLASKVGMVFQDPESQLVMTSVEQEIAFGLENLGLGNGLMKRRVMEVSSALALSDYLRDFIPELSGGQKQKVALASVMAMQPDILLLDEPTSQLDPVAAEEIFNMLRRLNEENGITIVLAEQRLERCFHLADRILVMDKGEVIYDHQGLATIAYWVKKKNTPFIPPLAKLFAGAGYAQIPVTVKQGRDILRSLSWPEKLDDIVHSNLEAIRHIPGVNRNYSPEDILMDIENLWFTYPDGKEALKGLNLTIKKGDFIALIGENGAGKTTLLKTMNGLLKASRGLIRFDGQDIKDKAVEDLAFSISYLSQDPNDYLFLPTVRQEILFTLKNLGIRDDGISKELIARLKLSGYEDLNPRDLSTGERQRVALAAVLVTKPRLLLLDEPTRGLDYLLKEELGQLLLELQRDGTAIVMITHDIEFAAEYAEDIVLMADGTIIDQGSKYEILANSTFYSPQISKLFHNLVDGVVTLEQGRIILDEVRKLNTPRQALPG